MFSGEHNEGLGVENLRKIVLAAGLILMIKASEEIAEDKNDLVEKKRELAEDKYDPAEE